MNMPALLLASTAILSCISIIVLILNLITWRRSRQLLSVLVEQQHSPTGRVIGMTHHQVTDVPISLLVTTLGRLERRIIQIEDGLKGRPAMPLAPAPAFNTQPETDTRYERAQQLIQESQSAEQVAQGSGLTLYEAELLLRIHRGQ